MNMHTYSGYGNYGQFDLLADPFAALTSAVEEALAPATDLLAVEAPASTPWIESFGWVRTRAKGILSVLGYTHPTMTADDINNFLTSNNLYDWNTFNFGSYSSADSNQRYVGDGGSIFFDTRFPWPSNGQDLFARWAAGENLYSGPQAGPVAIPAPVQNIPVQDGNNLGLMALLFLLG